jgi:hypothetical protein
MKKTLLIAAAALASSIISSQAQVYSQNIVGYANVPTAGGGTFLMAVPFQIGASNGANEVWPLSGGNPTLPDGSSLLLWNGSKYTTYLSDSGSSSLWDDNNGTAIPNAPLLPVGQGFFLIPANSTTNTFAGNVAVNVGTSNVMTLASGGTFLVAPYVPYAGAVTNGNLVTGAGGPNMWNNGSVGIPDGSSLLLWNGSKYTTYLSDSGSSSYWDDNNGTSIPVPPSISVGQGFFVIPAATWNWTVGL